MRDIFDGRWHTLLQVLPPLFLDPVQVPDEAEVLAMRIDSRTYKELPLVVKTDGQIITTLRTGTDPAGVLVHRALLSL